MPLGDMISIIQDGQRIYHDTILDDLHLIKDTGSLATTISLMLVGFVYGALHAIGPGHGKVIVSGYMLANEQSLKRGLLIIALSSLLQAIVAITLVLGFFYMLNLARAEVEHTTTLLEQLSYALIGLLGLRLFWRGIKECAAMTKQPHAHHDHHHGCTHDHDHHEGCAHTHAPDAKTVATSTLGAQLVMIVSIGMRPCSGAVLLLFFACLIGAPVPGILATFAMAVGTALTTGILAALTVASKNLALRFLRASDKGLSIAHAALSLGGGAVIILLSGLFLAASPIHITPPEKPAKLPLMHLPNSR